MMYETTKTWSLKEMVQRFCDLEGLKPEHIIESRKGNVKNSCIIKTNEFTYYRHYDTNVLTSERGGCIVEIDCCNLSNTTRKFLNSCVFSDTGLNMSVYQKAHIRYFTYIDTEGVQQTVRAFLGGQRYFQIERCYSPMGIRLLGMSIRPKLNSEV